LRLLDNTRIGEVRRAIRGWYRTNARDLPWRRTSDPYRILVSEIMLQQTQVQRVIPKYRAFLVRFPTLRALATASLADVLRMWSGLGYNVRAKRLWECAKFVVAHHGSRIPSDIETLRALPGIGRYTASAVASFAFGAHEAVADVNVRRVLARALLGRESIDDAAARPREHVEPSADGRRRAILPARSGLRGVPRSSRLRIFRAWRRAGDPRTKGETKRKIRRLAPLLPWPGRPRAGRSTFAPPSCAR
jgi:adenine-specific DNA glycosylase